MNWLDGLTETVGIKVPPDFYTAREIAALKRLSTERVSELLREQIATGKIVMRLYRAKTGQITRPIPHYGPAKCKR